MTTGPFLKSDVYHRKESLVTRIVDRLPQGGATKGVRSPHLWAVAALMAVGAFIYYLDQTPLVDTYPFNHSFFTGVHDIHRTLFLVPLVYAALVFRVRGSIITSVAFFCVVLPRALLFSPYPDPLLRPLLFVAVAALISLLIATQLDRIEKERRDKAELAATYQKLSEYNQRLKESQEQLIQAEKLSSLGQMAASIAHEINNPMGGVLLYTQLLIKKITSNDISKETALNYLSKVEAEIDRSTKLLRNLLDFARQSPPILEEVNINEIVNQALDLAGHSAEQQNVQFVRELSPPAPRLMADRNQLQQVCTNLILNAIQAMPKGGRLTVRTLVDNGQCKVEFQDTGYGISPENMRKLFTPFFTTKPEGKGVGLGLAVAHGIIQRHHGRIEVQSKEGEGTTFTIRLPVHDKK